MSRSSDLVPYLTPPDGRSGSGGVGWAKGVIVSWNRLTAENTVLVRGAIVENLPILNTSEAAILQAGDVVGLLSFGPTWGILGRFTIPGTPEAVSGIEAITNRITASRDGTSGTRNSTSFGDLSGTDVGPALEVTVGPSGRVLAIWSCAMGFTGANQEDTGCDAGLALTGANVQSAATAYALGFNTQHPTAPATGAALSSEYLQAANMHIYTGLNPGATTFTMKYRCDNNPSNPTTFSQRELALFVL